MKKGVQMIEFPPDSREPVGFASPLIRRSCILNARNNILVNGSLVIDVFLRRKVQTTTPPVPLSQLGEGQLKCLESGEGADLTLMVGNGRNRQNHPIKVHKAIIIANAPGTLLHRLISDMEKGNEIIELPHVDVVVMTSLLRFFYARTLPSLHELWGRWEHTLLASDQFELIDLKLAVESFAVGNCIIRDDNVLDWLTFADSHVSILHLSLCI